MKLMPFCPSLSQKPLPKQVQIRTQMKYTTTRRPEILTSSAAASSTSASGLRVFVLSDLHTDYSENMTWVKCLSTTRHKKDVLLVAGDVAEKYDDFVLTMSLLKDRFQRVLFVPGNHDLWCRGEENDFPDSLEKLNKLLDACRGLGVEINPVVIDGLGIIPLFSWYHESFDREKDISGIRILPLEMVIHFLFSLYVGTFTPASGLVIFQAETPPFLYTLMQ